MSIYFIISLLVQLFLIASFLLFGWQADQSMDKSGMGDLEVWSHCNSLAGIAFYGMASLWLATVVLAQFARAFSSNNAQLAIGVPPLALVLGWFLSWVA